jgi:hypothetical protein
MARFNWFNGFCFAHTPESDIDNNTPDDSKEDTSDNTGSSGNGQDSWSIDGWSGSYEMNDSGRFDWVPEE